MPQRYRLLYGVPEWRSLMRQFQSRRNELAVVREEAEERLGCSEGVMKHWEAGLKVPGILYLLAWAKMLGCRIVLVPLDEPVQLSGRQEIQVEKHLDTIERLEFSFEGRSCTVRATSSLATRQ
jgi:hypothetical protein